MKKNSFKNIVLPFLICFAVALAMYPSYQFNPDDYTTDGLDLDYTISSRDLASADVQDTPDYTPELGNSFHGFKEALAFKESRGDYFTVNTLGYLGKYQFGRTTLELLGIYIT